MEQFIEQISNNPLYLGLLLLWVLPWKGIALWKAAQNSQKNWFIAILVINSLALLEIIYIFFFGKKKQS
jgi:hypothetical protein